MPVDRWFSYGDAAGTAGATRLPPSVPAIDGIGLAFDGMAEEIIVVGERQRREFSLTRPGDALTGPRTLDAAQPVVPWPGATCTYKNLCYDMAQPPLRASLGKLADALFGD